MNDNLYTKLIDTQLTCVYYEISLVKEMII